MSEKEENIHKKKITRIQPLRKKTHKPTLLKRAFFQESFQSIFAILFWVFVLFLIKLWFWS